ETGTDQAGTFSLAESATGTTTLSQTGNNVVGSYSQTVTTSSTYTLSETAGNGISSFSLLETGTASSTGWQTGSDISGNYALSLHGGDTCRLHEEGTKPAGTFTEDVSGSDTFSLSESGADTTVSLRSVHGEGNYTRLDSGPGSVPGPGVWGPGSYSYDLTESGDYRLGSLSQSETGSDRYGLLELFNNPATANNGGAGTVDFTPFGAPFTVETGPAGRTGNPLSAHSPFADDNPGLTVADPVDGHALSGAATQDAHITHAPELYKK